MSLTSSFTVDSESRREQDACLIVNDVLHELIDRGFNEIDGLKSDDPNIYAEMYNSLVEIVERGLP